jgi:hypothetical protein
MPPRLMQATQDAAAEHHLNKGVLRYQMPCLGREGACLPLRALEKQSSHRWHVTLPRAAAACACPRPSHVQST